MLKHITDRGVAIGVGLVVYPNDFDETVAKEVL